MDEDTTKTCAVSVLLVYHAAIGRNTSMMMMMMINSSTLQNREKLVGSS